MNPTASRLLAFIDSCPSPYHTVSSLKEILLSSGYTELSEGTSWPLRAGGRYFLTRGLSSLIAFRLPTLSYVGFQISASHGDSPTFRLKENGEALTAGYTRVTVEKYGGMLCASWFDRPLSAAGLVTVLRGEKILSFPVDLGRDLFLIPSVAIHMNRSANEGATYNPAVDMQPIIGSSSVRGELKTLLSELCSVREEEILGADLTLYPRTPGSVWGIKEEFLSSPRLDDLQCVYATLQGFLSSSDGESLPLFCVFDSEEVGSATRQGAGSTFLRDTIDRIGEASGKSLSERCQAIASSFLVSSDNAHALHPNHPELSDGVNRPVLNGGVVLKHNAGRRYVTDALSSAVFSALCRRSGVPVQHFSNRPDLLGGSTLGNISGRQVSLLSADVGLPQLSMHSCYETAGVSDTDFLISAMTAFFSSSLRQTSSGEMVLS